MHKAGEIKQIIQYKNSCVFLKHPIDYLRTSVRFNPAQHWDIIIDARLGSRGPREAQTVALYYLQELRMA